MIAILLDVTSKNLLLGFMPESLGLLLFGVGLIGFAVGARKVFNRGEESKRLSAKAKERIRG